MNQKSSVVQMLKSVPQELTSDMPVRDKSKTNVRRQDQNPAEHKMLTIQVPFRVVKRGGRKAVQLPDGSELERKIESTMVKALARAFRWKRILEAGEFTTISELADHEKIAPSYMTRVLRLTLLAPDIIEAILDGKQGPEVTLKKLLDPFPSDWSAQAKYFGRSGSD